MRSRLKLKFAARREQEPAIAGQALGGGGGAIAGGLSE
jgi:hypothetical protein